MAGAVQVTGKEFEELIIYRARMDEASGLYVMGRYGVMATFRDGEWHPITSLPDFEGIQPGGHQFIFDAKVCSQASYDLSHTASKSFTHQYKALRRRDKFGALCFLLIHFNERVLKTKVELGLTILFPITDNEFWNAYDRSEQKSLSRNEAIMYGIKVSWNTATARSKRLTPDLLAAIKEYQNVREH
jgi:penicillin-binding protein-related factor A (putative recombinase)